MFKNRLEVQADVTSTQRFSLCSETASAATSLSEKSVNASIALDDGAASTRALAGSVLNFKVSYFSLEILLQSIGISVMNFNSTNCSDGWKFN